MFLHMSVILFTGGGGGTWAGTPRAGTPQGRYTSQAGTPPPGRYPPRQVHPWQCMLGYGQQTGGTHPTGIHSCLFICCHLSVCLFTVNCLVICVPHVNSV